MSEAIDNLYLSYPHLNSEKADDLLRHLLGFVTWDELINVYDIPKSVVPNKVSDVYPPIEENKIEFPIPASVDGVEREIRYRQIVRCLTAEILYNRGYEEGAYLVLDIGYEGLETEPIFDFISNTYDCMDDFDDIEDLREAVMDVATDVSNYFN